MKSFQEFRENLVEIEIKKSVVAKSKAEKKKERREKMRGGGRQRERLAIKKFKRSPTGKRSMDPERIKRMKRIGKSGLGKPLRVNITKGKSAQAAVTGKKKELRKKLTKR